MAEIKCRTWNVECWVWDQLICRNFAEQLGERRGGWGESFAGLRIKFSYGARLTLVLLVRVSIVSHLFLTVAVHNFAHSAFCILPIPQGNTYTAEEENHWETSECVVTLYFLTCYGVSALCTCLSSAICFSISFVCCWLHVFYLFLGNSCFGLLVEVSWLF